MTKGCYFPLRILGISYESKHNMAATKILEDIVTFAFNLKGTLC